MSTLTLQLPDELKNRLALAARKSGKSTARFVRETLEKHVKVTKPAATTRRPSLYELSRDLCGSVKGGPRDLARSKKHLNGYGSRPEP